MKVRTREIHLWSEEKIPENTKGIIFQETQNKTEKPTLLFWLFIIIFLYILLFVIIFLFYIESWSIVWALIAWSICFAILSLAVKWLFREKEIIRFSNKRFKKWEMNNFLKSHINNINSYQSSRYINTDILVKQLLKYLFWQNIIWKSLISSNVVTIIYWMWIIFIWDLQTVIHYGFLSLSIISIYILVYLLSFDYHKVKKISQNWKIYILRSNVKTYYILWDKIFFY